MASNGGISRRRPGRGKRATYIKPEQIHARPLHRKIRRGWAQWL